MSEGYASHDENNYQHDVDDTPATQESFDEEDSTIGDDASIDAAIAAFDLSSIEATSASVAPQDGVARKKKRSPLEIAAQFLGNFVQTLQWPMQISAYQEFGEEFLRLYSQWYHERQNIKKAEAQGAYKPTACRVNSGFLQPCDRAKGGPAYLSLRNESDAKCTEWSLIRGEFHLRMRTINNRTKRDEYIRLMAYSIWRMARLLLASIEGDFYGPHNLVADMLLIAHNKVFKELCKLDEFISVYKRIHKCVRDPEDPDVMYTRRFGTAAEPPGGVDPSTTSPVASPSQTDATHDMNIIPPTTNGKKTSTLPVSNLFAEETSKAPTTQSVEDVNKQWREKFAMFLAMAADSHNVQKMVDGNKKLAELNDFGNSLIRKEGGITTNVANILAVDERKPPATPKPNKKNPSKPLISPKLIYDRYSKKHRFTRDETAAESEIWGSKLDETMRRQLCQDHCLINSIRPHNFMLPGDKPSSQSKSNEQNTFNYDEDDPTPPAELNKIPLDKIGKAVLELDQHSMHIFYYTVRVFVRQSQTNKTIENITASEEALKKSDSAEKSTKVYFQQPPTPVGPVVQVIVDEATDKAASKKIRKTNNTVDALKKQVEDLHAELKSLRKLHKQKKKRKAAAEPEVTGVKGQGGLNEGAVQTNPISQDIPPAPPQVQAPPKINNPYLHLTKKQKKQRKQPPNLNKGKQQPHETTLNGGRGTGFNNTKKFKSPYHADSGEADVARNEPAGRGRGRGNGNSDGRFPGRGTGPGRGRGRGRH